MAVTNSTCSGGDRPLEAIAGPRPRLQWPKLKGASLGLLATVTFGAWLGQSDP